MINIINYYDIINSALLSILNTDAGCIHEVNDKLYIQLDSTKGKQGLTFYINDILKDQLVFGYTNILIHSCEPKNNRRNLINGNNINITSKFYIEDESVDMDIMQLQSISNNLFRRNIGTNNKFFVLYHDNLDCFDLYNILQKLYIIKNTQQICHYIVSDNNKKLFNIDSKDIELFYVHEVKTKMEKEIIK
jgi:hypothetical protein